MQTVKHDPANAPDKSKPYCLMNADGTVADWFATHSDAVVAMSKTSSARKMYSEDLEQFLTPVSSFTFADDGGVWIEALQAKEYHTGKYGRLPISSSKLTNLATSVKKNVRGIELSTDFAHGEDKSKGLRASGTIKDAKVDGDKLLLNVDFTPTARQEIKDGEWKYFSTDWLDTYLHDDGSKHTDVLLGGGLTNRPVAKGLAKLPINFSELYEEVYPDDAEFQFSTLTSAERKALPASQYLYVESDGTKHLPVPDEAHIRNAISRLSQKATGNVAGESWLTDSLRSSLLAKARAMLNKKSASEDGMNPELKALLEKLNIQFSEDTTDEQARELISTKFSETDTERTTLLEEVKPLRALKVTADAQKQFAEAYPEQAKRLEELSERDRVASSRQFSEEIGARRFSEATSEKDKDGNIVSKMTSKGLSGKALEVIQEGHRKFAEGTGTPEDYEKAITAVFESGIVDYGETGTSVALSEQNGNEDVPSTGDVAARRNAFAEKVVSEQTAAKDENEGKGIQFAEATSRAAKKFPKLAEDYMGAK